MMNVELQIKNKCECACHNTLLLSDPPKHASDYCKSCLCNEVKETLSLCPHGTPEKFHCVICFGDEDIEELSPMIQQIHKLEERIAISEINIKNADDYECSTRSFVDGLGDKFDTLESIIEQLKERIKELEAFENCMVIGQHPKILQERIDLLERTINSRVEFFIDKFDLSERDSISLKERIEKLEKNMRNADDYEGTTRGMVDYSSDRIRDLEKTVNELTIKIANIANFYYKEKKTPHICPICNSTGKQKKYEVVVDGVKAGDRYSDKNCHVCEGKGILWG